MSNYIDYKVKDVADDPNHIVLITGDFNINSLKDSEDFKEHVLSYNELNHAFLKYSEEEYEHLIRILEKN